MNTTTTTTFNTTTITTTLPIFPSPVLKTQIQYALNRIASIPLFSHGSKTMMISPLDSLVYPNEKGYTPLHYAAASDDFEFAKSLVFIFVSVGRVDLLSAMDGTGRSPLHWAVDAGSMGIVRLLIENGVMPNPQDHDGLSPLHIAVSKCSCKSDRWQRYCDIFGYLIARADINIADINGVSALHLAAELGDVESIRSLIEYGAWVNIQDHQGENPLFYAVRGNQYQAIRALVEEFGINMDMVNEDEEHILDLCRAIGQPCLTDLVKCLFHGRIIHQKMICSLQESSHTSSDSGFIKGSGQNIEIIANHSGYIRLSGHSCA